MLNRIESERIYEKIQLVKKGYSHLVISVT